MSIYSKLSGIQSPSLRRKAVIKVLYLIRNRNRVPGTFKDFWFSSQICEEITPAEGFGSGYASIIYHTACAAGKRKRIET
jgi:hypothetical protein